jgi:hypothetical protein
VKIISWPLAVCEGSVVSTYSHDRVSERKEEILPKHRAAEPAGDFISRPDSGNVETLRSVPND